MEITLQHRVNHMAEFLGYSKKYDRWYDEDRNTYICGTKDWNPHQNWNQLMRVYEKVCEWKRTSEMDDGEGLIYIDRFEVGTNKIFISVWCVQADGEFGYTNIFHGHSRLESVQGDCDSTKEMFFKSLSDFVTLVQYTKELHG